MARSPQQFDRAAEFWDRHAQRSYLVDEKSLTALEGAIEVLDSKSAFGLEHVQAFTLTISVCEAQIRDCIRLAFDAPYMPLDTGNPLMKEVSVDYTLLNSVRDRHFSLGEFFALNTSVSTVSRFLSGAALGFPGYDLSDAFASWDVAKALTPKITFEDLKSSLAFAFEQRNRFIHEFSELVAAEIGKPQDKSRLLVPLRQVFLLLRFIQFLKVNQYSGSYNEEHPSRGAVGKELNQLTQKIKNELDRLDAILRNSQPDPHLSPAADVRKAIAAFRSAHSEYLHRLSTFYYYAYGPGTIVHDFIYGAHLEELGRFEERIARAIENQEFLRTPQTPDGA
ncbi:hypothetical protein ACVWXP_003079 [Bradyrhizobium sp. USDA 4463]